MATLIDDWSLVAAAVFVCLLVATLTWGKRRSSHADFVSGVHKSAFSSSSAQVLEDKQQQSSRRPGGEHFSSMFCLLLLSIHATTEWLPVEFNYPNVEPCLDDLGGVKPIPYRPFKWGEYL